MSKKPPYRIPTMVETNALPRNGLRVISTFAGGGGSSLGYRMAGFKVLAASEFVPAAADVYELNATDGTIVIRDDIREISGRDILDRVGLDVGELDVLDGSPPCSAFSSIGKKSAGWGAEKRYSDTRQVVDDLFFEFSRIVGDVKPRVFVAENVAGLGRGQTQGYFMRIYRDLESQGYRVKAKVLNAKWLGIPQNRPRLIFVGVREDQPFEPVHPKPLRYQYTIADVLPHITGQVDVGVGFADPGWRPAHRNVSKCVGSTPSVPSGRFPMSLIESKGPTITKDPETGADLTTVSDFTRRALPNRTLRRLTIPELRIISSFPADFELTGSYLQRWERLGRAVPPLMMRAIASTLAERMLDA